MSLAGLLPLIADDPAVAEAMKGVGNGGLVVPSAAIAPTIAAFATGVAGRGASGVGRHRHHA